MREGIDGLSRWIGMRWEHADTVRVTIRPELINGGGLLSGAVTYALNRRLAVMRSEVHHDDGRLLATAVGSYTIFPRKPAA